MSQAKIPLLRLVDIGTYRYAHYAVPLDAVAGTNLVNKTLLKHPWIHRVQQGSLPKLQPITRQPLHVKRNILLCFHFGSQRIGVWFGVASDLAVDKLLGTSYVDRFIHGIFLSKRRVVSWHSH